MRRAQLLNPTLAQAKQPAATAVLLQLVLEQLLKLKSKTNQLQPPRNVRVHSLKRK